MAANSFGEVFRLTSFGESHGQGIGGIIDGCPPRLLIDHEFVQFELNRRRPGQSHLASPRQESDKVEFLSGIIDGVSTGAPIAFAIWNSDQRSGDYDHLKDVYRPSHADYTYQAKYGIRDHKGGGRSSARETIARVVAGAIAKQYLREQGIEIIGYVSAIGSVKLEKSIPVPDLKNVEASLVRCPDVECSKRMQSLIEETKSEGDTLGGIISCHINGMSAGLGAPVFDKFHADLGKAMLSINAVKGFDYGSGFDGVRMKGSEQNDLFVEKEGRIRTMTNNSGGIQGGITNGEEVFFRVAFKPVATVMRDQNTIDSSGNKVLMKGKGRHDVCVVPRAVVIVEAMAAMVAIDHFLRNKIYK
ncbi:MAG: chorismate synthase [Bacteroidetes bacterium HGW-Bacteroidetes-1]|jgi:chorismate synthase|nr:MAG: chorismate synthase [Bacteroidetes bacterium HGW-Bacteroidetes-1]